jgi:two-component SAPR family response regulator
LTGGEASLAGRRILVVEDDFNVARALVRLLKWEGAEICGPAASVNAALAVINNAKLDGAVLDINLRHEMVYPVADALLRKGVPIVFTSGYDKTFLEAGYSHLPCIEKPCTRERLLEALLGFDCEVGRDGAA